MGKFLNKFKNIIGGVDNKVNEVINRDSQQSFRGRKINREDNKGMGGFGDDNEDLDDDIHDDYDPYDEVGIQPTQKPESFHHFILENQYKDLERSIRGFKDVFEKDTQKWRTIRKKEHCFTDEEAEEILRTAQSHLATDIKLSLINSQDYGELMMAIYKRIDELFYSIAEYRYGRYGDEDKQYQMKLQNRKIFLELWTRIQANYSRAIAGQENKQTHDSVKGQESLQRIDEDYGSNRRYS